MLAGILIAVLGAAGAAAIYAMARRDHRAALAARAKLLDGAARIFAEPQIRIAADGFPILTGRLPDRRQARVELVPDTLIMRRLPQLWLVVTLGEAERRARPSLGALARPTGSEFYSRIDQLPERIDAPPGVETSMMIRGDAPFDAAGAERAGEALRRIFADPRIKEVMALPNGVRIVRQAAEGDRNAHLFLRQVSFPVAAIDPEAISAAIADADILRKALDPSTPEPMRLCA